MEQQIVSLRDTNRKCLQINRQIHRDELNDVQRSVTNRYTCEGVSEIVNRLKTKACISAIQLNQLKNALLDEPHNIESFLATHGALRGIVGQLTGSDVKKQCAAAGCLCNLAMGDTKACLTISRSAGTYLVAAIDNMATELAVNCVWTLGNLAASSLKTSELLISQGALGKMAYIHTDTELQEACLYAMNHFVYQLANDLKVGDMRIIVETLTKLHLNKESSHVLFLLSCHECFDEILTEDIILILLEYFIDCMEKYLSSASMSCELVYICRTLANTNAEVFKYILNFIVAKNLSVFCKKILAVDNAFVNNSMLWLFGNIYTTCPKDFSNTLLS